MATIRQEKIEDIDVYVLDTEEGTTATVAPEFGAACSSITYDYNGEIIELLFEENCFSGRRMGGRIPVLFPAMGRVAHDGKLGFYRHKGEIFPLDIHGFAKDEAWRVVKAELKDGKPTICCELVSSEKTLKSYPYDFNLSLTFTVSPGRVDLEAQIENRSPVPMPFSYGYHPYFRIPIRDNTSSRENCEIQIRIPGTHYWENINGKPTGRFLPLSDDERYSSGVFLPRGGLGRIVASLEKNEGEDFVRADLIDSKSGLIISQEFDPDSFETVTVHSPSGVSYVCIEPRTGIPMALSDDNPAAPSGKILSPAGEPGSKIQLNTAIFIKQILEIEETGVRSQESVFKNRPQWS